MGETPPFLIIMVKEVSDKLTELEEARGIINSMMVHMSNDDLNDEFKSNWYKSAQDFMYPVAGEREFVLQAPNGKFVGVDTNSGYPYETNRLNGARIWTANETERMLDYSFQFKKENWVIREVTLKPGNQAFII